MTKHKFRKYLEKIINREFISYGIFGILTAILNIGLYQILICFSLNYKYANFITIIVTKVASYIVNKLFVYKSKTGNLMELFKEFWMFVVTRGFTMLIDYFGLIFLVDVLGYNETICKYVTAIVVIVINYFLGKKHVFKTEK